MIDKDKIKVLIVASDKGGKFAPFIEEQITALEEYGVVIVRYPVTRKGIVGYLQEVPSLRRMIKREKPDVVHAHFGLSGLLANLQRMVPVVTTYHGSDINNPSTLRFSKMAMWLSKHNIFVSKRNINIAQPKKNYSLLPCGVNLTLLQVSNQLTERVISILKEGKINVLFAGAFDNVVKDPQLAQQVIEILSHDVEQVNLIELKGYMREEVVMLMHSCNVLLMTSKTEGSPQVIKEAMACGCPIVSVDVGDVAERIEGVDGCFVVKSREPVAIADALKKAVVFEGRTNGCERIIAMGLSNEQVVRQLLTIYQSLNKKR
ncbi:MAG: glycosyltransferase [Paludibacteraceae bacterium]|nr:glycosyltransferase [Paludibacteraceae bacterium]